MLNEFSAIRDPVFVRVINEQLAHTTAVVDLHVELHCASLNSDRAWKPGCRIYMVQHTQGRRHHPGVNFSIALQATRPPPPRPRTPTAASPPRRRQSRPRRRRRRAPQPPSSLPPPPPRPHPRPPSGAPRRREWRRHGPRARAGVSTTHRHICKPIVNEASGGVPRARWAGRRRVRSAAAPRSPRMPRTAPSTTQTAASLPRAARSFRQKMTAITAG